MLGWVIAILVVGVIVAVLVMNSRSDKKLMFMSDDEFEDQTKLTDAGFKDKWEHEKPTKAFRNQDSFILKKTQGTTGLNYFFC